MLFWRCAASVLSYRFYFCWRITTATANTSLREIAQEVFNAAGDPKVFPEQLKDGLQPWHPLAVIRCSVCAIKDGKMFDYATGKWLRAVQELRHGEWSTSAPSSEL